MLIEKKLTKNIVEIAPGTPVLWICCQPYDSRYSFSSLKKTLLLCFPCCFTKHVIVH